VNGEGTGGEPPEIDHVRAAHRHVDHLVAGLDDPTARQPSLLPGWTVGHVLTHMARNADGMARLFDGAARGEVVEMYVAGADGRQAAIEAGHARPAGELVADLRASSARLEAAWAGSTWVGRGRTLRGEFTLPELMALRWREVAVHTVDLGLGDTWNDLTDEYVRSDLRSMTTLWASRRPLGTSALPPEVLSEPPQRQQYRERCLHVEQQRGLHARQASQPDQHQHGSQHAAAHGNERELPPIGPLQRCLTDRGLHTPVEHDAQACAQVQETRQAERRHVAQQQFGERRGHAEADSGAQPAQRTY